MGALTRIKAWSRIGVRELGLMKPTAYFVNTARGRIVDETALAQFLGNEGVVAGRGLIPKDVEPRARNDIANPRTESVRSWRTWPCRSLR
jgi:D-isomer specific 2-hydroxyacid dehydrogenase, NAD binding domain